MTGLREGLGRIKQELADHLTVADENDNYGKQMLAFYQRANRQLEDLEDDVKNAESTFVDAINYYGEDDKNMTSSEFYGIFKTFVTSYKVHFLVSLFITPIIVCCQKCKSENHAWTEEKLAVERRKQALEERTNRLRTAAAPGEDDNEGALDRLIQSLKNGKVKHRRRRRPTDAANTTLSSEPDVNDSTYNARDMLAQLQAGGFIAPSSPTISSFTQRRRHRRTERGSDNERQPLSPPTAESLLPEANDSTSETADSVGEESTADSLDLSYFR